MFPLLALLFLAAPIAELAVIIAAGQQFGVVPTIAGLLLAGVVGAWLARREGFAVWRRLNEALADGRMPTEEIADGALILLAGALMAAPGFIGDALGLILLIPPLRAGVRRVAMPAVMRYAERKAQSSIRLGPTWPGDRGPNPWTPPNTGRPWIIDGDARTSENTRVTWGNPESEESPRTVGRGEGYRDR